jgi:hypothetical protein
VIVGSAQQEPRAKLRHALGKEKGPSPDFSSTADRSALFRSLPPFSKKGDLTALVESGLLQDGLGLDNGAHSDAKKSL